MTPSASVIASSAASTEPARGPAHARQRAEQLEHECVVRQRALVVQTVGEDLLARGRQRHVEGPLARPTRSPDAREVPPEPRQADGVGEEVVAVDVADLEVAARYHPCW